MTSIRKPPFFAVPEPLATITTGNERSGNPATMLARHNAIGLTWRSNGNSNLWVRGTFTGGARPVDFCSIASANALAGTTLRLRLGTSQAQVDGSAPYDSGAVAFINPSITREDGLYHAHLELPSTETATWWRIDIGSHTGDFEAAMLVLGQKVEAKRFYNRDYQFGIEDMGSLNFTRWGVPDEAPGIKLRTVEFTLDWESMDDFEASWRPLAEKLGSTGIVFLCFDPEPTATRQARTYMGRLSKPIGSRGRPKPTIIGQDFQLDSFI